MKRRIAMLLVAAATASSLAVFSPASPASAHEDVCAGTGTATLGVDLVYPAIDAKARTGGFFFMFSGGTCALKGGLSAAGVVSGWCGLSSGEGTTDSGHDFVWLGVGGELAITGEVTGNVNAIPNALAGESCVNGANNFLVQGAASKIHCRVTKTKFKTTDPVTLWTVWLRICI